MRILVILSFLLASNFASAQYRKAHSNLKDGAEYVLNENGHKIRPAEFKNGFKGWMKYLRKELRYPKIAKEQEIQGKVLVQFIVDSNGDINPVSVKVVQSLCEACDLEAIRVIRQSGRWIPARDIDEGKNIQSQNIYAIIFRL